jgi:hypothetical protein
MRTSLRLTAFSFVLSLLLVQSGFSDDAQPKGAPQVQVQSMDPAFDAQAMKEPGVQVHAYGEAPDAQRALPSPREEDRIFSNAGLSQALHSLDQVDRDILFLRARDLKTERLQTLYPKLSAKKLKQLADLAQAAKKGVSNK